jgi:hypothetical protein
MVFFRHLYYVRVPFVDGALEYSWLMNPAQYNYKTRLLKHLNEMKVGLVGKVARLPIGTEGRLRRPRNRRDLVPEASTDVDALTDTGRIFAGHQKFTW